MVPFERSIHLGKIKAKHNRHTPKWIHFIFLFIYSLPDPLKWAHIKSIKSGKFSFFLHFFLINQTPQKWGKKKEEDQKQFSFPFLDFLTPTKQNHQPKTKIWKEKSTDIPSTKNRDSTRKTYRNPKWSKRRNSRVNDLLSSSHNGNGSSMFAKLSWNLKPNSWCSSCNQSHLPLHYISLEWWRHGSLSLESFSSSEMGFAKLLGLFLSPDGFYVSTSLFGQVCGLLSFTINLLIKGPTFPSRL